MVTGQRNNNNNNNNEDKNILSARIKICEVRIRVRTSSAYFHRFPQGSIRLRSPGVMYECVWAFNDTSIEYKSLQIQRKLKSVHNQHKIKTILKISSQDLPLCQSWASLSIRTLCTDNPQV